MFGGEVTMYLPVQQHSLVARCATYFTLHHNQYFPSSIMCLLLRFIMVITTKSPRIFCASNNAFASTLQFMSYVFIQRTFSGFKQLQDCRNYLMQEKVGPQLPAMILIQK